MREHMTDEKLRRARMDILGELDLSCECADEEESGEEEHVEGCPQAAAEAGFNAMCFDHDRARRAETEQAAELVRLTATIKALADALETARRCIVNRVTRTEDWDVIDAALQRAVGRR